ncbi:MAG: 6,7-dimethyl-8-ribityllumazine synthase [Chloroflexi bacterium]|nr:6,7-dimethyl-8-ribityllumazine synthase [Chloroflexota bacterium]
MPRTLEGTTADGNGRFAIVVSRFNEEFTTPLLDGALRALDEAGVDNETTDVVWVPGAFEIPIAAIQQAKSGRYDAVICLGVVLRSDTPHFDYVAGEASRGIMEAGLLTGVPIIFGVLTVENREQAEVRTLPDNSNRGYLAGQAGLEMASLMRKIG